MMNLTPTELERLVIFNAAEFARRHKRLGVRLSHPEAVALIADEMLLAARAGRDYHEIIDMAGRLLTAADVLPGVAQMLEMVSVEGSFAEGTKMLVVFRPIAPEQVSSEAVRVPGEIITPDGDIELNGGRDRAVIEVLNTGDRDIQVRSHSHFFEINNALRFDRRAAWGMRLDVPSGTGVRFEPGIARTVTLVAIGGAREVRGFKGLVDGPLDEPARKDAALAQAAPAT